MNSRIKVLLVDDHAVVRAGFKMLLSTSDSIEVAAEAERGEQAIQLFMQAEPDVVVMDISMPGIGGLETIRRIIQRKPTAKILVFSVHHEPVFIQRALDAGAQGYITKNSAPENLPQAIAQIMQGEVYVEPGLLKKNAITLEENNYQAIINGFSAREFDIFRLLAGGLNVHKIAEEQCLGYKTVANYATQIKKKLHVNTVTELVRIAHMMGISK